MNLYKDNMACTPLERGRKRCEKKNEIGFMVKQGVHAFERIPPADSLNDIISED